MRLFWQNSVALLSSWATKRPPSTMALMRGPGSKLLMLRPFLTTSAGSKLPMSLLGVTFSSKKTSWKLRSVSSATLRAMRLLPTPGGPTRQGVIPVSRLSRNRS